MVKPIQYCKVKNKIKYIKTSKAKKKKKYWKGLIETERMALINNMKEHKVKFLLKI